jgi:FMN-dependent NADH-azoreductase
MSIKVLTQEDVTFETFVRETGKKITINGQDVFTITTRGNAGEPTVLRISELIGMFRVVLIFFGIFWLCSPAAKWTISNGS